MIINRRTWDLIIIVTTLAVDLLKVFKDKFKNGNGGKKDDSSGSSEKE